MVAPAVVEDVLRTTATPHSGRRMTLLNNTGTGRAYFITCQPLLPWHAPGFILRTAPCAITPAAIPAPPPLLPPHRQRWRCRRASPRAASIVNALDILPPPAATCATLSCRAAWLRLQPISPPIPCNHMPSSACPWLRVAGACLMPISGNITYMIIDIISAARMPERISLDVRRVA